MCLYKAGQHEMSRYRLINFSVHPIPHNNKFNYVNSIMRKNYC